jgi:mRNA-degrading endonuclease toxin of MazEF toxin-antitoxin module
VWRPKILLADLALSTADWKAKESWIQTDQIVTIDVRRRALRHVATLTSSDRRSEIETRLREILGLD